MSDKHMLLKSKLTQGHIHLSRKSCVVSIVANYGIIAPQIISNKKAYCQDYSYHCYIYEESLDTTRPIPWSKLKAIELAFKNNCSDVMWIDADAIIVHGKPFEQFIKNDITVSRDFNGINTGVFFTRSTDFSVSFLRDAYNYSQFINHVWWEQRAIIEMYNTQENVRNHISVQPQHKFNSYKLQDDVFVYHTAGCRLSGRKCADKLMRAISASIYQNYSRHRGRL